MSRSAIGTLALVAFACGVTALAGCAERPAVRRSEPWAWVRFVGKAPPRDRYTLVGRVEGVAPDVGFVEAVRLARIDIRQKAALMGAQLVRIQSVKVPPTSHREHKAHVLLVGRAYRAIAKTQRIAPSR